MTTRSIADPLAESYISVVHRLLDELTKVAELTAENAELKVKLAAQDAHTVNVAEVMAAARITDEDLEAEALEYSLPAFPAPFPNRFPIYNTWREVPDGIVYEAVSENSVANWVNHGGVRLILINGVGCESVNDDEQMADIAPFVEVK